MLDNFDVNAFGAPPLAGLIECALTYVLPLIVVMVNYSNIIQRLFSISDSMKNCAKDSAMDRSRRKAKERAKTILILVGIFLICSFPRHIFLWIRYLVDPEPVKRHRNFWHATQTVSFYLYYLFPILNPVSLYLTSEQFKNLYNSYLLPSCCRPRVATYVADHEEEEEMTDPKYTSRNTASTNQSMSQSNV